MAQQTSVDFLWRWWMDNPYASYEYGLEAYRQAKEMHKEQMHKCASFWRGKENDIEKPMFNEWYNETYNK